MSWKGYSLKQIVSGKSANGSLLLEGFLKDYSKLAGVKLSNLQPSCPKCLNTYFNEYTLKNKIMNSNCDYKLHKKYNGIPLDFGSQVLVTNANITNEYAETLISRYLNIYKNKNEEFDVSLFFEKFPNNWNDKFFVKDEDLKLSELREKYPETKAISKTEFLEKLKQ